MIEETTVKALKHRINTLIATNKALVYVLTNIIEIMEIHEKDEALTAEEKVKLANSKALISSGRMAIALTESE